MIDHASLLIIGHIWLAAGVCTQKTNRSFVATFFGCGAIVGAIVWKVFT